MKPSLTVNRMDETVSFEEIAEHIQEERITCSCGQACFDIPGKDDEAMIINLHAHARGENTAIGPFVAITCHFCGEVKFLYVPTIKREKETRESFKLSLAKSHSDSQKAPSVEKEAGDSSADGHP